MYCGFPIPVAAAILSAGALIIVAVLNNIWVRNKINTDKEMINKTILANNEKLKEELFAQSSKTYKELVSSEKIKALNALRDAMAEYLAQVYSISNLKLNKRLLVEKENVEDQHAVDRMFFDKQAGPYYEVVKASFLVQLRLKPCNNKHEEILKSMNDIDEKMFVFLSGEKSSHANIAEIMKLTKRFANQCQNLLGDEWELVDEETKPHKN